MAYHDFYAEIAEIDPSLSREENCRKLKEALTKWRKRHGSSARVLENLIHEANSVFGNEVKYRAFREQREERIEIENVGSSAEDVFGEFSPKEHER